MTVPVERTNAVINTEQFLLDLINPKKTPRVPRPVRDRALALLRHYPSRYYMDMIAEREDQSVSDKTLNFKIFGKGYI